MIMEKKLLLEMLNAQLNLNCALTRFLAKVSANALVNYKAELSQVDAALNNCRDKSAPVAEFLAKE